MIDIVDALLEQARLDALAGAWHVAAAIHLVPETRRRELARPLAMFAQSVGAIEVVADDLTHREAKAA